MTGARKRSLRRFVRPVLVVFVVGMAAWALLAQVMSGTVEPISIVGLLVGLLALARDYYEFSFRPGRPSEPPTAAEADKLAGELASSYREEAEARRISGPDLLPLSWTMDGSEVADESVSVVSGNPTAVRLRMSGRMNGNFDADTELLADSYEGVPSRRLVILGEPGAGKSALALLLTLGLLRHRESGGPVPVVVPVASWDPRQPLDQWIESSVADARFDGRTAIPVRLLEENLLLPVLDGLDEIPELDRRRAIEGINKAIADERRPLVLTCRSAEYEDLIMGGAPTLDRAPVVRVDPLTPASVVRYLGAARSGSRKSWQAVFDDLLSDSGSPLRSALSTPLMVTLLRSIHERLGDDPTELLNRRTFRSRHAIEGHLTDRIVDAAYAADAATGDTPAWTVDEARAWLGFLARKLYDHRERELVWWRMSTWLLSPWIAPALGVVGGLVVMALVAMWLSGFKDPSNLYSGSAQLSRSVLVSAACGITFTTLIMITWYTTAGRAPGRLSLTRRGAGERLRSGFVPGAIGAALAGAAAICCVMFVTVVPAPTLINIERLGFSLAAAAVLILAVGLVSALHSWLNVPSGRAARLSPEESIRQDRRASVVASAVAALGAVVVVLPAVFLGIVTGSTALLVATGWIGWPGFADFHLVGLARMYDMRAFFEFSPTLAAGAALLVGVVFFALFHLAHPWPRFLIMRLTARLSGRLPLDLPGFLADACRRDLLRQNAGAYQFRHARLQERLATHFGHVKVRRAFPGPAWAGSLRAGPVATVVAAVGLAAALLVVPDDGARAVLPGLYGDQRLRVALSPDGRLIAMQKDRSVVLWDIGTGEALHQIYVDRGISDFTFGPDGRVLVVESAVRDDEPQAGTVSSAFDAYSGRRLVWYRTSITFLAGGRTLAVTDSGATPADDLVEFWDVASATPVRSFRPGRIGRDIMSDSTSAAPSLADGCCVIVKTEAQALLVNAQTDVEPTRLASPEGDAVEAKLSTGTSTIRATGDTGVHVWDARDGRYVGTFPAASEFSVDVSMDTRRLVVPGGGKRTLSEDDDMVTIVDYDSGRRLSETSNPGGFSEVNFSRDGRLVLALDPTAEQLWVWDAASGRLMTQIPNVRGYGFVDHDTGAVGAAGADLILVTSTSDKVRLFDTTARLLASGEISAAGADPGTPAPLAESTFSDDSSTELGAYLKNDENTTATGYRSSSGSAVLFSPDTHVLATTRPFAGVGGTDVKLVDRASGRVIAERPRASLIGDLTGFTPDGSAFLATYPDIIQVLDAASGRERAELRGFQLDESGLQGQVAIAPDGSVLAVRLDDQHAVGLWDLHSGRKLAHLVGHSGPVDSISFSGDSRTLVTTGAADYTVRLWDVPRTTP